MHENYSKKLFGRANQRAKILIANPEFKEEILEIRKTFKIPLQGIKDNKQNEKWHHDFYESDDIYFETNRERVRTEIEKLEQEKKFQEGFNLNRKFNKETPLNSFHFAIKSILSKYKLPIQWHHSIQRYILFNSIDTMWLPGNIHIRKDFDQDTDLIRLSIEIDDATRLKDIIKSWPMVKFHQEKLKSYTKKKFQPIKNFERDQMAYNLKQSGNTYNEIADILSLEYDKVITSEDVASYIKRYKKSVGIN